MTTRTLAEFIVDADTGSAPARIRELALQPIADTIGCMVAGVSSPAGRAVLDYAGLDRGVSAVDIWGSTARPADPERRALVGGTLGAALDFDDVSSNGHPSSILVSAILSADNGSRLSGRAFVDAYLVGYEVGARLGDVIHLAHSRYGWHTTSTIGYFGAAAAACRLYRLDVDQTRNALGIAASMSAGLGRNHGTMTKPLHSGLAAQGGLAAARLAAHGITASSTILEGPRSYLEVYGLGQGDAGPLQRLGSPWAMEELAPSLKKFPACYVAHRLIDAVLELQRTHDLGREEVASIVVRAPTRSAGSLVHDRPETGLEATFSAHYAAAAAFEDRRITIGSFDDAAVVRPEIQRLIELVDVAEDPRCRPEDPEAKHSNPISGGFWEVTVHTRDDRALRSVCAQAPGSPARPLSWTEIDDKFVDCATSAQHDGERAGEVLDSLHDLTAVPDVHRMLERLGKRTTHA